MAARGRALAEKVVRKPRSVGCSRQVFPRYVAVGNAKRVARREWLIFERVSADYDEAGNLIGVEIIG